LIHSNSFFLQSGAVIIEGQYLMGITLERHCEGSAKTKIRNFEATGLFVHQQVLWLQIPTTKGNPILHSQIGMRNAKVDNCHPTKIADN
jgi:hypothetical protein